MYVRPQGYSSQSSVELPKNYGGSAFREILTEEIEPLGSEPPVSEPEKEPPTVKETSLQQGHEGVAATSPFGNKGIGSEELLLLALIFLLSEGEGSDELMMLLILLLFIK